MTHFSSVRNLFLMSLAGWIDACRHWAGHRVVTSRVLRLVMSGPNGADGPGERKRST
jgi:hypothetical protein